MTANSTTLAKLRNIRFIAAFSLKRIAVNKSLDFKFSNFARGPHTVTLEGPMLSALNTRFL